MCFREDTAMLFGDGKSIRPIKPCFEYVEDDKWTDALCEIDSESVQARMYLEQCPHPGQFTGRTIPSRVYFESETRSFYDEFREQMYNIRHSKIRRLSAAGDVTIKGEHNEEGREELGGANNRNFVETKAEKKHFYSVLLRADREIEISSMSRDECIKMFGKECWNQFVGHCLRTTIHKEGSSVKRNVKKKATSSERGKKKMRHETKGMITPPGEAGKDVAVTPEGSVASATSDSDEYGDLGWAEGLFPEGFESDEMPDTNFDSAEVKSSSSAPSAVDSDASGDVSWAEGLFTGGFHTREMSDEDFDWAELGVNGMYLNARREE